VNYFMNRFRRLGFIEYNGEIQVHNSLLAWQGDFTKRQETIRGDFPRCREGNADAPRCAIVNIHDFSSALESFYQTAPHALDILGLASELRGESQRRIPCSAHISARYRCTCWSRSCSRSVCRLRRPMRFLFG
jgi:hypothetical protein